MSCQYFPGKKIFLCWECYVMEMLNEETVFCLLRKAVVDHNKFAISWTSENMLSWFPFFSPNSIVSTLPPRYTDVELRLLRTYRLARLRKRWNFKQVPDNRRLKSFITLDCFKFRHQKSYLMDWSWWSYNGFHQYQTEGCNGFLCRLAIGSLSVAPALHGALYTFAPCTCSWGTI